MANGRPYQIRRVKVKTIGAEVAKNPDDSDEDNALEHGSGVFAQISYRDALSLGIAMKTKGSVAPAVNT